MTAIPEQGPTPPGEPSVSAPHRRVPARTRRRGGFFLHGDWLDDRSRPLGPAWVEFEAPVSDERSPVILVHGGGGQSTDWMGVYGVGPSWAETLVDAGHPVYLLDRPGHGRSPWDPDHLGARTSVPDREYLTRLFRLPLPGVDVVDHARWESADPVGADPMDAILASSFGAPLDTRRLQALDAARLVELLRLTGPAIVMTHSAGAPAGWLAADAEPDLVSAVVAIEPMGPPYRELGVRGALENGIVAPPLRWEESGGSRTLPSLARVPVLVVSASASGRVENDRRTVAFLHEAGVRVEHLVLRDHGLFGDGHGLVFERHVPEIVALVRGWLDRGDGS